MLPLIGVLLGGGTPAAGARTPGGVAGDGQRLLHLPRVRAARLLQGRGSRPRDRLRHAGRALRPQRGDAGSAACTRRSASAARSALLPAPPRRLLDDVLELERRGAVDCSGSPASWRSCCAPGSPPPPATTRRTARSLLVVVGYVALHLGEAVLLRPAFAGAAAGLFPLSRAGARASSREDPGVNSRAVRAGRAEPRRPTAGPARGGSRRSARTRRVACSTRRSSSAEPMAPGSATSRAALARGTRVFIAAGGDGTAHALLNALVDAPGRPPLDALALGAVGLGSSNDLHKPVRHAHRRRPRAPRRLRQPRRGTSFAARYVDATRRRSTPVSWSAPRSASRPAPMPASATTRRWRGGCVRVSTPPRSPGRPRARLVAWRNLAADLRIDDGDAGAHRAQQPQRAEDRVAERPVALRPPGRAGQRRLRRRAGGRDQPRPIDRRHPRAAARALRRPPRPPAAARAALDVRLDGRDPAGARRRDRRRRAPSTSTCFRKGSGYAPDERRSSRTGCSRAGANCCRARRARSAACRKPTPSSSTSATAACSR